MNDRPPGTEAALPDYPREFFAWPYFKPADARPIVEGVLQDALGSVISDMVGDIVTEKAEEAVRALALLRAGDTMLGHLFLNYQIPSQDSEAASKYYVDMKVAGAGGNGGGGIPEPTTAGNYLRTGNGTWVAGMPLSGGSMLGALTLNGNATSALQATPLQQVQSLIAAGGGGGIPEPGSAGNWLRTGSATWVQGLPLSGGILNGTVYLGDPGYDFRVDSSGAARFNNLNVYNGFVQSFGSTTLAQNAASAMEATTLQQVQSLIAAGGGGGGSGAGVTDGSEAATGNVGEVIEVTNTITPTVGDYTVWAVAAITLSAGDWDMSGWFLGRQGGGEVRFSLFAARSPTPLTWSSTDSFEVIILGATGTIAGSMAGLPTRRYNLSAPQTITLYVGITTYPQADPFTFMGRMTARRMR